MTRKLLKLSEIDMVSLVDAGDNPEARVTIHKRLKKAPTKTEDGRAFPAGDYAYVPDAEKPSTWKLRLTSSPGGAPDARIVGAAVAALGPGGYRGQRVQVPVEDLAGVKARVRAAWLKANPEKDRSNLPTALKRASALEKVFAALGRDPAVALEALGVDPGELEEEIGGMSDENLEKRLEELEARNAALEQRLEARDAIAKAKDEADLDRVEVGDDEDLRDRVAARRAELAKAAGDEELAAFAKKLPEPLRGAFTKLDAEAKAKFMKDYGSAEAGDPVAKAMVELTERNAALEKRVEAGERRDALAKLKADLGKAATDEQVEALYRLEKADPDAAATVREALRAALAQADAAGLFKELGDGGGDESAAGKLEALAKARAEKDGVTYEEAYDRVIEEHKDLAAAAVNEEEE